MGTGNSTESALLVPLCVEGTVYTVMGNVLRLE